MFVKMEQHSVAPVLGTLSVILNPKNYKTKHFGNLELLHSSG
jgi:hypothetical protein